MAQEWQVQPIDRHWRAPFQRIALVTDAFLPKIDGVSKLAVLTARHHLHMGREVLIVAPHLKNQFGETPSRLDGLCEVVSVPSVRLGFFPQDTRMGLPALHLPPLERFKPDVVHLFSPAVLAWTGIWYALRQHVPLMANYQTDLSGYTEHFQLGFAKETMWHYLRFLHNHADMNLAPTTPSMADLCDRGFKHVHLWQRGADTHRFSPRHRSSLMRQRMLNGRPDDCLLVVYVGRLSAEKSVELLIEVAHLEGVALTIVGDGVVRPELERLFGDKAHFMGFLRGDDLTQAYASADLFVFSGTKEVAGQAVKEAMTSGLPVIIPNAGGIVDYVVDGINGYLCDPTPSAYRQQVAFLRDHPDLRQRMAHRAYEMVTQFSWEDAMTDLERLYQVLLRDAAVRWQPSNN